MNGAAVAALKRGFPEVNCLSLGDSWAQSLFLSMSIRAALPRFFRQRPFFWQRICAESRPVAGARRRLVHLFSRHRGPGCNRLRAESRPAGRIWGAGRKGPRLGHHRQPESIPGWPARAARPLPGPPPAPLLGGSMGSKVSMSKGGSGGGGMSMTDSQSP